MSVNRFARSTSRTPSRSHHFNRRRTAVAATALCLGFSPVWAQLVTNGSVNVYPGLNVSPPNGIANADLGNVSLSIGNGSPGSFSAMAGSQLRVGSLNLGNSGPEYSGNSVGTAVIDGAGTKVSLMGDGFSPGLVNRMSVGSWGKGSLTVSGGAVLDGRAEAANCVGQFHYCNVFIGNAAGSDALFTVTGAGSQASFLQYFGVGGVAVFRPPIDGFTFGTPGGTTRARVEVLNGGTLTTDGAAIGIGPNNPSALGTERSFAEVAIDGANSVWRVTGGNFGNTDAFFSTANHRNAVATLTISNGGKLHIDGPNGISNGINLTQNGGRTDMLVTGTGSTIAFTSDTSIFQVGRRLGSAFFALEAGASVTGVQYASVGRDGSFGEMVIDGMGTLFSATGMGSAAANGGFVQNPTMDIGRNGTGVVTVRNGAHLELKATQTASSGPRLDLGRDVASSGTLNITGPNSVVQLQALSAVAGGGANEAYNPLMRVGRDGNGALNITQGGKLLMDGQAVSTQAYSRNTMLYIGGNSGNNVGGKGIAQVTGLGSEIRLTGSDTIVAVGRGPQSYGQLTVADQASISAMGFLMGDAGGTGVLKVDNSTLNFAGQQTGDQLAGAFVAIGNGGGVGVANLNNHSVLNISNMGSAGAGLYLGGLTIRPLGDGNLTLSGNSQINIQAAPGLGRLVVGRDGSALVRVKGGSSINVGDGNTFVAQLKGSDGTMILSEGSTLSTGFLGVGRNKTATGTEDGGTGTVVLVHSTLNAQEIVIGTNGFLGGSGTITGNITNYGTFAPGNSPGTLEIDGAYVAAAGSRIILEVESDGHGGFNTDHIIFKNGETLDLTHLNAEFRFLGATDPNSFKAQSLFNVDTFFQMRQTDNSLTTLDRGLFSTAVFSASAEAYTISNFSFNAGTGATFIAAAVPEPGEWAMMLAGLLVMGSVARRRNAARKV